MTKEIEDLKKLIAFYDNAYYNDNKSTVLDVEYDALKLRLKELTGEDEFDVPDTTSTMFAEITHSEPILSLAKVTSKTDLVKEIGRLNPVVVQPKIDGLTVVLYPNGKFVTRGRHGLVGEDISHTCKKALPSIQFVHPKFPIRMEVYMDVVTFEAVNRKRLKAGQKPFENRRNAAAGILRNKDVKNVEILSYFAYNLVGDTRNETDQLQELQALGFTTVMSWPYWDLNTQKDFEKLADDIIAFNTDPTGRKALGYDIDGLVIKSDRLDAKTVFGAATGHHPKNAVAFKWEAEGVWTKPKNIVWQVGRTGMIAPVLEFEPIRLGDATVTRATLHNIGFISALKLKMDSEIFVVKANDVIPAVTKANGGTIDIVSPTSCPACGGDINMNVSSQIFCVNDSCGAKVLYNLVHAASKDALDIDGLSEETIKEMIRVHDVKDINDVLSLTKEDILMLDRKAEKSAVKLYNALQEAKEPLLNKFIYTAGIANVGRKASDDIAARLQTYDAFIEDIADGCEIISQIDGIGPVIVDAINKNVAAWVHMREILNPKSVVRPKAHVKSYTFVITGTLSQPRSYYEDIIKNEGSKCSGSVSAKTDYLLAGDKAGSKLTKAQSLGVEIMTEEEFNKFFSTDGDNK